MKRLKGTMRDLARLAPGIDPALYQNRLVVSFNAGSIRNAVNGVAFTQKIEDRYGSGAVGNMLVLDPEDKPREAFVFVHPSVDRTFVEDLVATMEFGENLDDDAYWKRVGEVVREVWTRLPTSERIELIERAGDDLATALATEPSDATETLIYQEYVPD